MPGSTISAGIVGGSGYLGGELLRLLTAHPRVEVVAATSRRLAGRRVDGPHPNLRGVSTLRFCAPSDLPRCDVLFFSTPHGVSMTELPARADTARHVVDLSADFRLHAPEVFERYYGSEHAAPELLPTFVPGWPELHRDALAAARRITVPGCMSTAAVLALRPLAELAVGPVWIDGRIGSSGSGAAAAALNIHAERSGALRVFAPAGHRHEAEVAQATGLAVSMSATGIPAVRGVQVLCRVPVAGTPTEAELRRRYRACYAEEPFVRVVAEHRGMHRLPDPKILYGSNYCDVGFAAHPDGGHVTAIAALDNLMKGGAGNAVQCLNVCLGWPERLGLDFAGLHPV